MEDYDKEALIERLLNENRRLNNTLTELEIALHCDERTQGLTLMGAVQELFRQRDRAESEIDSLNEELDRLTHEKVYKNWGM